VHVPDEIELKVELEVRRRRHRAGDPAHLVAPASSC
jgi:hypothetical protein